jgi:hypothetical protein
MTRIFSRCIFLFFAFFLLGLSACHKDKDKTTVINGIIADAKTGLPIQGVVITYSPYVAGGSGGTFIQTTNIEGKFTLTLNHDVDGFSGLTIQKGGYVPKFTFGIPFQKEVVNDFKIVMHPRDALLRLVYENTSNQEKRVYTQARSSTFSEEYGALPYIITQPYPYICQPNSKDTLDYPFTSDEQINLFWDFSYYTSAGQAAFKDSLLLNRGDTVTYSISF